MFQCLINSSNCLFVLILQIPLASLFGPNIFLNIFLSNKESFYLFSFHISSRSCLSLQLSNSQLTSSLASVYELASSTTWTHYDHSFQLWKNWYETGCDGVCGLISWTHSLIPLVHEILQESTHTQNLCECISFNTHFAEAGLEKSSVSSYV